MMIQIFEIRCGFGILILIQSLKQLFKSLAGVFSQVTDRLDVIRINLYQPRLGLAKDQDVVEKRSKRFLFGFFDFVRTQNKGEVPLSMQKTALLSHPFRQQVIDNSCASVGKQNLKLLISQTFLQILTSLSPSLANPEPHRLDLMPGPQRSQRPAHLLLTQVNPSWSLKVDFRFIYHKKSAGCFLHRRPHSMSLRNLP